MVAAGSAANVMTACRAVQESVVYLLHAAMSNAAKTVAADLKVVASARRALPVLKVRVASRSVPVVIAVMTVVAVVAGPAIPVISVKRGSVGRKRVLESGADRVSAEFHAERADWKKSVMKGSAAIRTAPARCADLTDVTIPAARVRTRMSVVLTGLRVARNSAPVVSAALTEKVAIVVCAPMVVCACLTGRAANRIA